MFFIIIELISFCGIIPKSKNSSRLEENLNLNFTINENDMNKLKNLDEGRSLFGWYSD